MNSAGTATAMRFEDFPAILGRSNDVARAQPWVALGLAERTYYRRKAAGTLDVVPPPMQHAAHVADWFATLTGIERLEHKALVRRCIRACLPACEARLQSAPT